MKIYILSNGIIGYEIASFLKKKKENIVGIGVNSKNDKYSKKILKIFDKKIIPVHQINRKISIKQITTIKNLNPDVILVVYWSHILKKEFFSIPKYGCINFHLAYLPYNRGKNPNFWSIVDDTPAGTTIHKINEKIDAGEIICQEKVAKTYLDNGKTLFFKLQKNIIKLFKKNWSKMKKNKFKGKKQILKKGKLYYSKDFNYKSEIKLNKKYYAKELINLLRAKMFPPNKPSFFMLDGKKYFVEIKINK